MSTLSLTFVLVACKRPPDAPAKLDDLSGYLFEHFLDEDPAALQAGMNNLQTWLAQESTDDDGNTVSNLEATVGGYVVTNLSQEAVDVLDDRERDLTGLVGAAAGYAHDASMGQLVDATIMDDPTVVYEGSFVGYERTYKTDADCFLDQECELLEVHNYTEAEYALGLTVASDNSGQYRWVETDQGCGYLQRTWLDEEATVSFDWLGVPEQYYLVVTMPFDGNNVRVLATWMIAEMGEDATVPEDMALNLVIDSLVSSEEKLDTYCDEGGAEKLSVDECPSDGLFH